MVKTTPTTQPAAPILSPDAVKNGIKLLKRRISEIEALEPQQIDRNHCPELVAIEADTGQTLAQIFGQDTEDYKRYRAAAHWNRGPYSYADNVPSEVIHRALRKSKDHALALLNSAIRALEERSELFAPAALSSALDNVPAYPTPSASNKIFVVHGHDNGAKHAVARFIEQLGFDPVILHEQPNQGRTIIEKVEEYADVGFAVVLLTADDHGAAIGEDLRPRARQNVILELGYFLGRLGRNRVCAIMHEKIEEPSDFTGVVYVPFDDHNGWYMKLAVELKAAGYSVDLNKVMLN